MLSSPNSSKQHYYLVKDESNLEIGSPLYTFSPPLRKSRDFDYSADADADGSVSSHTESPIKSFHEGSPSINKGISILPHSKGHSSHKFLGEFSESADERGDEEGVTAMTLAGHHRKFVNGLPTVVTRKNKPTRFYCTKCHFQGKTRVKEQLGKGAAILSVLFFFMLFWPCLVLICYTSRCKDFIHECPNCGHVVGKKKFLV